MSFHSLNMFYKLNKTSKKFQIVEGDDYYRFVHEKSKSHKSLTPNLEFHQKLNNHPHVRFFVYILLFF